MSIFVVSLWVGLTNAGRACDNLFEHEYDMTPLNFTPSYSIFPSFIGKTERRCLSDRGESQESSWWMGGNGQDKLSDDEQ